MRHTPSSANSLLASGMAILIGGSACGSSMNEPPVEPRVDAITIGQVADTIYGGQTVAFSASLRAGGVEVANNGGLRWVSSSPAAFTVDSLTGSGRASDVSAPSAVTVTAGVRKPTVLWPAFINALSATSSFIVFPKGPGIKILMSSSVAVGRAVTPTLLLYTLQRQPVTGAAADSAFTQPITGSGARLESLNPAVLRVNSNGILTAVGPGTTRVAVDVHGARDSVSVTVFPGYVPTFLPGTAGLRVVDVNDSGDVVAAGDSTGQSTLIRRGQQIALGSCDVQGINNRGQVLCSTKVYDNGVFTELFGTGVFRGEASGIDETGSVFGLLAAPDTLRSRAFLWHSGTIDVYPPVPGRGLESTGRVAAGGSGIGLVPFALVPTASPAILHSIGQATFLQGAGTKYSQRLANDINDAENVVGTVDGRAKLWLKSDGYKGEFLDTGMSTATAISESNDIVGGGPNGAFFWSGGRYVVVSDAVAEGGWSFSNSPVISRNGTIAVTGTNVDGRKGIVLVKLQ